MNVRNKMTDSDQMARRSLLKIGMYIPPTVFGMAILGIPETASAVVDSCLPSACQPCIDLATGIKSETNKYLTPRGIRKKTRKCRKKRKKIGRWKKAWVNS